MSVSTARRVLYPYASWYFLAALVVTLLAFFPSYLNRLPTTDGAHHLHGISAFLWLLLLCVQPMVYRLGYIRWHRMLGRTSFILVPVLVISGLFMIRVMLHRAESYPPGLPYQLAFIDFVTLAGFCYFYVQSIRHRRRIELHARYMVCTVLGPLIPALTRFLFMAPGVDSFSKSLNASYVIIELVLIALIVDDKRSGKFHAPYVAAVIFFVVQHILMTFAGSWEWWIAWMDAYAAT